MCALFLFAGQTLTPATGFTALTLFNLLRFPLDCFPEMLNYLVRTKVSIRRIESFLRTPDVKGITDACNLHGEVGGTGSAEAGRGRKKYADHEFAPHAYEEFHPAPVASSPSRAVRSPLIPGNGTRGEASAAEQPLPATGTVVLRDLKLGWSPTLREEGEDSDKQRKTSMPSVKELCFCMSRAQRVPAVAATKSQPRDGKSRNGKPATAGQNSKYQLLNGADDENSSETSTASGGFSLLNPAKINAPMSEEFYTDDDNNASHESDMENRRADGHHSPRSPRSPKTNAPNGRSPRSSTPSSAHSNGDNETSDAVAPTIILDQTSFTIPRGALAVVVGVTGSGKSSLLQGALLGEGLHLSGIAAVGGRISYASQSAWIQNATLRDNVLFGTPYDKERYDKVVFSCALLSDFKLLPAGDMTEIGKCCLMRLELAFVCHSHGLTWLSSSVLRMNLLLSAVLCCAVLYRRERSEPQWRPAATCQSGARGVCVQ
jgi:ABC-type multidrug transport system fused ATPase/permease subunit